METKLADRWHPLSKEDNYSLSLHKFLDLCSRPAHSRPEASGLLKASGSFWLKEN
jgi:serine/threonine-protein kinase CLA4